jgi:hypothetical protein
MERNESNQPTQMEAIATGIVHPMKLGWMIERPVSFVMNGVLDCRVVIRQSHFNVIMRGERPDDLGTLLNQVGEIVQACLDSLGFWLATPLRIELLSMIIDGNDVILKDGRWAELLPEEERENPTYYAAPEKLGPLVDAAINEPLVRLALADLRTAIDSPGETVALAYRAIESIRQWFLPSTEPDTGAARRRSWEDLKAKLDIPADEIRALQKLATARRHGENTLLPEADRLKALRLARRVVEQFLAHRASVQPEIGAGHAAVDDPAIPSVPLSQSQP